jgi:hydroxyacylglutathione hydrolase
VTERKNRAVRLSEHLYQVGGDRISHRYDASAYLLTGPEPAMIDCGSLEGWPAIRANVLALGADPAQIRAVLGTHCHYDHVTGFPGLAEESGAQLFLADADAHAAATGDPDRTASFLYGRPAPPVEVAGPLPPIYESGPVRVQTIFTPGHTPGSSCFVVTDGPVRILIAADTLFGGFHPRIGSDIDAWTESLARLAAAEYDFLCVGHAHAPLLADAHRIVEEARLQLGVYFQPWFRPFHIEFTT